MKKIIFSIILLIASTAKAGGPLYRHKEATEQLEFENVYQDISRVKLPSATSQTLVQLQALTPASTGLIYYCSNCTVDAIVVSTGTSQGAFSRVSARTTAIQ